MRTKSRRVHGFTSSQAPGEIPPQETTDEADTTPRSRKGRPEMPSWDDIVFGTKSDDDSDPA